MKKVSFLLVVAFFASSIGSCVAACSSCQNCKNNSCSSSNGGCKKKNTGNVSVVNNVQNFYVKAQNAQYSDTVSTCCASQPAVQPAYLYAESAPVMPVASVVPVTRQEKVESESSVKPYLAAHLDINMMSWKNKYSSDAESINAEFENDKYTLKPFVGADVALGLRFNENWRADIEGGYLGSFSDEDSAVKFSLSGVYGMVNVFHDFSNGVYFGVGVGVADIKTSLEAYGIGEIDFIGGDKDKSKMSVMAGAMLGYSWRVDDNMYVDARYRLSTFKGTKQKRDARYVDVGTGSDIDASFENEIGTMLNNTVSIGLRYEF